MHSPQGVSLATGDRFDALQVPAAVGLRLLGTARLHAGLDLVDVRGPVAELPSGAWIFLVRPGTPLRSELDDHPDVRHHGGGTSIPAPPTRTPTGTVRWVVPPQQVGWRLPAAAAVQSLLVAALEQCAGGGPRAVGGRGPRAVGGRGPRAVGGRGPEPVDGGGPRAVGGRGPEPVDGGGPRTVGRGGPEPVGRGRPEPVGGGRIPPVPRQLSTARRAL